MSRRRKYCRKQGQDGICEEEPENISQPTPTNMDSELREWHSSYSVGHHLQKPDICYPEFDKDELDEIFTGNDIEEIYFSSSPLLCDRREDEERYCDSHSSNIENNSLPNIDMKPELSELFGKQFRGMEDTFRSALLQYFAQVDKEKRSLSEDLKKIKEDFFKYEKEGRRLKIDSMQKSKLIRKLTENGKLFVKEIEKLRNSLKNGEEIQSQLLMENKELQKKIDIESEAIPRLEKELRSLNEENQYLKLLADDTEKLNKQECEIRRYENQIENQIKELKRQANELTTQRNSIKKLSGVNDELSQKVEELSKYKNVLGEMEENKKRYIKLQQEHQIVQRHFNSSKSQLESLSYNAKQLEMELEAAKKKNEELQTYCMEVEEKCVHKEECIRQLDSSLRHLRIEHDDLDKRIQEKEDTISIIRDENLELNKEIEVLKKEMKVVKINADSLVYEDETRSKEMDALSRRFGDLEVRYRELMKKEQRQENEISRSSRTIESLTESEERYKARVLNLQENLEEAKNTIYQLQSMSGNESSNQEAEIEKFTSLNKEIESKLLSAERTAEELKASNEACTKERSDMYQELLSSRKHVFYLEEELESTKAKMKLMKEKYETLENSYMSCEDARKYLENEITMLTNGKQAVCDLSANDYDAIETAFMEYEEVKRFWDEIHMNSKDLKEGLFLSTEDISNYRDKIVFLEERYRRDIGDLQDEIDICRYERDVFQTELNLLIEKYNVSEFAVNGLTDRQVNKFQNEMHVSAIGFSNHHGIRIGIGSSVGEDNKYKSHGNRDNLHIPEVPVLKPEESNTGNIKYKETVEELDQCRAEVSLLTEKLMKSETHASECKAERITMVKDFKDLEQKYCICKHEKDGLVKEIEKLEESWREATVKIANHKELFKKLFSECEAHACENEYNSETGLVRHFNELHALYASSKNLQCNLEKEVLIQKEKSNYLEKESSILKERYKSMESKAISYEHQIEVLKRYSSELDIAKNQLCGMRETVEKLENEKNSHEKLKEQYESCIKERNAFVEDMTVVQHNYRRAMTTVLEQEKQVDDLLQQKSAIEESNRQIILSTSEAAAKEVTEMRRIYISCEDKCNIFQKQIIELKNQNHSSEQKACQYKATKKLLDECNAKLKSVEEELLISENKVKKIENENLVIKTRYEQLTENYKKCKKERNKFIEQCYAVEEGSNQILPLIDENMFEEYKLKKEKKTEDCERQSSEKVSDGFEKKDQSKQQRYYACEDQRNRLQRELLILAEKYKNVEEKSAGYEKAIKEMEELFKTHNAVEQERLNFVSTVQSFSEKHDKSLKDIECRICGEESVSVEKYYTEHSNKQNGECGEYDRKCSKELVRHYRLFESLLNYIEKDNGYQKALETKTVQYDCMKKQFDTCKDEIKTLTEYLQNSENQIIEYEKENSNMNKLLEDFQNQHLSCEEEKSKITEENRRLKEEVNTSGNAVHDRENILRKYEAELNASRNVLALVHTKMGVCDMRVKSESSRKLADQSDFAVVRAWHNASYVYKDVNSKRPYTILHTIANDMNNASKCSRETNDQDLMLIHSEGESNHHEANEVNKNDESDFAEITLRTEIVHSNERARLDERCKNLEELSNENKSLREDLIVILSGYNTLHENHASLRAVLQEREAAIKNIKDYCTYLEKNVQTVSVRISKDSVEKFDCGQNHRINIHEECSEQVSSREERNACSYVDKSVNDRECKNIVKEQNEEANAVYNKRENRDIADVDEAPCALQDTIVNLRKIIDEKDEVINKLRNEITLTLKCSASQSTTADLDNLLSSSEFKTDSEDCAANSINHEEENPVLVKEERGPRIGSRKSSIELVSNESLKYREKYFDILESSKRKEKLIEDLQEYAENLEGQISVISFDPGNRFLTEVDKLETTDINIAGTVIITENEEKEKIIDKRANKLRLPIPVKMSGDHSKQTGNILPSTPDVNKQYKPLPKPRKTIKMEKHAKIIPFDTSSLGSSDENAEIMLGGNVEELKRANLQLNSKLVAKKIEIDKLEDELREAIRKKEKIEDSYRDLISRNESFEEEIVKNRRRIEDIQERHKTYELTTYQHKHNNENLAVQLQHLKEKCELLEAENRQLQLENREGKNLNTNKAIFQLERESNRWKRNAEVLENEIQLLSNNVEILKGEIDMKQKEINTMKMQLYRTEKERDSLKSDRIVQQKQIEDMLCENENLRFEISEKKKVMDEMQEQLRSIQQEQNHSNIKVNQGEINLQRMERQLRQCEEENDSLYEEIEKLKEAAKTNDAHHQNMNSEKEIAIRSSRYLENKVNDLQKEVDEKDEILLKYTKQQAESETKFSQTTQDLDFVNSKYEKVSSDVKKERETVASLEKLNDAINKENKRLMIEISVFKDKIESISEEKVVITKKMEKLEKDYSNLDHLFSKTQESNSELLVENKATSEQLIAVKQKLQDTASNLELTSKEKESIENSLIATNEELQQAYESLNDENKEMSRDYSKSKKMIAEYEAILEQGQVDFTYMETQLEKYQVENYELDKQLHKKCKDNVNLHTEKEEVNRCMRILSDEVSTLRTQVESGQRDCDTYLKEKENIEAKFLECKSREEYFEERLLGFEKIVQTKDELLRKEKKETEKIQDSVLKLQSELIVAKTQLQVLLMEKDEMTKESSFQTQNIENLQKALSEISSQTDDLESKLGDSEKQLSCCEEKYSVCKKEYDELERRHKEMSDDFMKLEKQLEDEKMQYSNEKGVLLSEISQLKRHHLESEVLSEKHSYKEKLNDTFLKEAQETNTKLKEKVEELERIKIESKEKLIETVREWERKVHLMEEEKSIEVMQIKASLEAIEETRLQDVSLLKIKLEESEELKRKIEEKEKMMEKKEADIDALKDDIIQLQTSLNKSENSKKEVSKQVEQLKVHVAYLEQTRQEIVEGKKGLEENLKMKVDSLKLLEEEKLSEYYEKHTLLSEKVALKESYDKALQTKDSEHKKLNTENMSLKTKLSTLKSISDENESLKNDLDSMLDERKLLINENSQLRSENYELRASIEKMQDTINENRLLKQQMRSAEIRHNEILDTVNREKSRLRKNYDDLFKTNQELELRNVGFIRTQSNTNNQNESSNVGRLKFKTASVDALNDIGVDIDTFSPSKNGVATSTPNQETPKVSTLITRASSLEMLNTSAQRKPSTLDILNPSTQRRSPSADLLNPSSVRKVSQHFDTQTFPIQPNEAMSPNYLPLKVEENENIMNDGPLSGRNTDASWWQQGQNERRPTLSIKSNPFLQMDKKAKSSSTTLGGKSKSAPLIAVKKENTPKKTGNELSMYDMRSKSTDTALEAPLQILEAPRKPSEIGNQYVNRLKETFEKKQHPI